MPSWSWIVAGLFLPLFPLGMLFNLLFQRVTNRWSRVLLLLVWPLPGVWIVHGAAPEISSWILAWALLSAGLYGFRAVVVREFSVWIGFIATSSWALGWMALANGASSDELLMHVLAFSLPLALLMLLTAEVEKRYESAYAGIVSGLAQAQPRLSGLLVLAVLAVIGSPLFPAFFAMLTDITHAIALWPMVAFGIALVWLLWSWSGVRLLQELLVGPAMQTHDEDISQLTTTTYGATLVALVIGGLYLSKVML